MAETLTIYTQISQHSCPHVILEVVNYIIGRPSEKFIKDAADMNGDGDVNITDVDLIKNVIMTSQ